MNEQLALGLGPDKSLSFENFYTLPANRLLLNQLKLQAIAEAEQWVLIHGQAESGRSHLLQASCQLAAERGISSAYMPLQELQAYNPEELFEGVESLGLLCVDDVDLVCGRVNWEEALFHVYNRSTLSGTTLLFASAKPASALSCQLADLQSRLNSFSVYHLHALGDEDRLKALQFRAQTLGMELGDEEAEYLYHRASRQLSVLFGILDRLDKESLRHQRALTKPFIKSVMQW